MNLGGITVDGSTGRALISVLAYSLAARLPGYDESAGKVIRAFTVVGGSTPGLHGLTVPLIDLRLRVRPGETALAPAILVVGFDNRVAAVLVDDVVDLLAPDGQTCRPDHSPQRVIGVIDSDAHSIVLLAFEQALPRMPG